MNNRRTAWDTYLERMPNLQCACRCPVKCHPVDEHGQDADNHPRWLTPFPCLVDTANRRARMTSRGTPALLVPESDKRIVSFEDTQGGPGVVPSAERIYCVRAITCLPGLNERSAVSHPRWLTPLPTPDLMRGWSRERGHYGSVSSARIWQWAMSMTSRNEASE